MLSTSVSLDMYEVFGDTIETFRARREKIKEAIWSFQIQNDGWDVADGKCRRFNFHQSLTNCFIAVDLKVLSRWLAPQDRVLALLGRDHTAFADQQAEFTCLWFQDDLSKFIKGEDQFLLINGQPGSGKTTLAASIMDRLQRPFGRRQFSTLFCSIGMFLEPW
jgi:DNA replication protein DnaC